jgi:hypothetical protein
VASHHPATAVAEGDHPVKFDPAVALATACSVEQTLAIKWETKQEEMRQRGDPRKAMCLTDRHWGELHFALARVPPGVHPDAAAEHHLLQILKDTAA